MFKKSWQEIIYYFTCRYCGEYGMYCTMEPFVLWKLDRRCGDLLIRGANEIRCETRVVRRKSRISFIEMEIIRS